MLKLSYPKLSSIAEYRFVTFFLLTFISAKKDILKYSNKYSWPNIRLMGRRSYD
jgi:hypothetical protein